MFYEYLKFNWTRLMNLPYLRLCKIRSTDFVIIPRLGKVTLRKWRKRANRQVQSALLFSKCKKYFPFFKNCQLPYIFSPYTGEILSLVLIWHYFTSAGFFGTSHQATLPAIKYQTAYIGFKGSIPEIIPQGLYLIS